MIKYLLAFCLLSGAAALKAQTPPYHPMLVEGRSWDVFNSPAEMSICTYVSAQHLFLRGDTLLDGIGYKKVYFNNILSNPPVPFCGGFYLDTTEAYLYVAYFREDTLTRKVFMRYPDMQEFAVFDFSLQAGDTLHYPSRSYPIVDVVDWVLADGSHRKAFKISDFYDNYYIEGIGYLLGAFNEVIIPFEGWNRTTCVREDSKVLYTTEPEGGPGCILATSGTHSQERTGLTIAPNPFSDQLTLHFSSQLPDFPRQFNCYNWNGQRVFQKELSPLTQEYLLDLPNLPSGAYFWAIDGQFGGKLMKW